MATVIHCPSTVEQASAPSPPPSNFDPSSHSGTCPEEEQEEQHLYPLLEGPPAYATLPFNGERSSSCGGRLDVGGRVAGSRIDNARNVDHVDFVPRVLKKRFFSAECEYERFDALISRANAWLEDHPLAEVRSCETMEWSTSASSTSSSSANVCTKRSTGYTSVTSSQFTKILSGLRMWYRLPEGGDTVLPEGAGLTCGTGSCVVIACRTFLPKRKESFEKMIDRVNRLFENDKFGGEIISSEVISRSTSQHQPHYNPRNLRPNKSYFRERPDIPSRRVFCLRVYAKMGDGHTLNPNYYESLGYKDFLPQFNKRVGVSGGYECFRKVMTSASSWIAGQRNVKFINLQTLRVKRKDCGKFQERTQFREHQCASNRMNPLQGVNKLTPYVTLLRVYFTIQRPANEMRNQRISPVGLTYRTFSPRQLTKEKPSTPAEYETTRKLMDRIQLWLQISGANVFHSETVRMQLQNQESNISAETTFSQNGWNSRTNFKSTSQSWIYHIRLYLDGEYYEPPSALDLVKNPPF